MFLNENIQTDSIGSMMTRRWNNSWIWFHW